ncbi:erythromycin esterase family protein [Salinirubrum litoreum]|uniref:Erythromycin esterase family protein n=1 Tax=Salinirubrum litoreum TaxID=1126234 RepID=A0ABD5RGB0_9EURY|nr:erythromycin esterase family protein [Salinirubrum litoreum]
MADHGADGRPAESVRRALHDAIVPCDTVDPFDPLTDLAAFGTTVGDATVVGLGEPSHGTREVFRLKHRLFRYLVTECGCRTFAIEANVSEAFALDAYVKEGDGTARDRLLDSAVHDVWHCESVLALLEWIRSYNERHPDDQIGVAGFDMQHNETTADHLRSYLETVDPDFFDRIESDLTAVELPAKDEQDVESLQAYGEACDRVATALTDRFDESRQAYVEQTSPEAFERARHQVRVLGQAARQFDALEPGEQSFDHVGIRDEAMAENVARLVGTEDDLVAVWAHNDHVKRGSLASGRYGDMDSMGERLAARDDVDYVPVGISIGSGSVRSYSPDAGRYEVYPVSDLPAGSLPATLTDTGLDVGYLDLTDLSETGPLGEWFARGPARYSITGTAIDGDPVGSVESNPKRDFDGLAFVRKSSPAVGLTDE